MLATIRSLQVNQGSLSCAWHKYSKVIFIVMKDSAEYLWAISIVLCNKCMLITAILFAICYSFWLSYSFSHYFASMYSANEY